ncbi:hypothetical protein PVK06_040344 [Gossypium arboreum]|uniref:SWIM-type domain-containing protein n=1 Tax=Gossypium arboreum TaxID=29729 RepID=A0ABR0N7Y9_GOSAR|nr:hypothetical protein PVK06_040344 [Gossypium arboreum]
MLAILCSVNEEGTDYLCNIPFEQWTQAYENLRYGYMTSNLAECINSILKGTRHLLIIAVVRETYFRLAALFPKRAASYKGQMQGGHVWCAKVLREINKAKARANTMHIVCHDHDNLWFHVTEFDRLNQGIIGGQYRVHSRNRACDCGVFDALRYPCVHVIAACQNIRLDPMTYVDQVYKIACTTCGDMYSHRSQMNVSGRLYRLLRLSCYRIKNCVANQRVDLARLEYIIIWIFEKQ